MQSVSALWQSTSNNTQHRQLRAAVRPPSPNPRAHTHARAPAVAIALMTGAKHVGPESVTLRRA